ncbi:hypothetical protein EJB05_30238, partial [Eragrostis curvula]
MVMKLADRPPQLTLDNYREILVRLPTKDVLRCGTICMEWRSITTNPAFLADHARRQEADQVLLYKYLHRQFPSNDRWVIVDIVLEALHVSGDEARRQRLIHYPNKTRDWLLIASSYGVLLFRKGEGLYLLCNPLTRKWADLPRLTVALRRDKIIQDKEYAFYFHQPSNEYRLLCRLTMPVPLHGHLHWPPHQVSGSDQTSMVVFDMRLETFTEMAGPPTTTGTLVKLFDMDGLLVGADFGKEDHIDLWFLESYGKAGRWELRHQVAIPSGPYNASIILGPLDLLSVAAAGNSHGNVMLGSTYGLVVYNVKTRQIVKTINTLVTTDNNDVVVSRHMFRANLVQHPHFAMRPSAELPFVHF